MLGDISSYPSITCDSREVVPGCLFIAVKGSADDGRNYIEDALKAGAADVVETDRRGLALIADEYYHHPSGKLKLVAVTGTNGKTTTATLLYELFSRLGFRCGLISTIADYVGSRRYETLNTTPGPITINRLLSEMVADGCEYCFMEASSIGLEQGRVTALEFAGAIFTNLTREHLEYHKTMEDYFHCKKLLFDALPQSAFALVNIDDKYGKEIVNGADAEVVTYSGHGGADCNFKILEKRLGGMRLLIDGNEVFTRLTGEYNAYNLAAVYYASIKLGVSCKDVIETIPELYPPKGRLEIVRESEKITVIIDYAHTPDALESVLKTIRETAPGRYLVCLFGCTGERDRGKRPMMARIAGELSDKVIVTSDDLYFEQPEEIFEDIRAGFDERSLSKTLFILNRKEAILKSLEVAPEGAIVLLAGKGHETFQIVGSERVPFDERTIIDELYCNG